MAATSDASPVGDNGKSPSDGYRGCLAVAGGFLVHLTLGTVFSLGNLTTYMTSYVRARVDHEYSYEAASWIYTGNMVARGVFTVIGGYLEWRIGPRFAAVLGCALATYEFGTLTTAFSIGASPTLLIFTEGVLFGAGIGLAYIGPLTCGMKWFPEHKGLVSGVVVGGFGLGSFVFSPIQTMFLNPDNMAVNKETGYFEDEDVLNRVPSVFHLLGGLYAALQIIACCLLRDPPVAKVAKTELISDQQRSPGTYQACSAAQGLTTGHVHKMSAHAAKAAITSATDGQLQCRILEAPEDPGAEKGLQKKENPEDPSLSPRQIIRCREFYMLFMTFFFNQQAIGYGTMMYKPFGQRFIDDDRFLTTVGSLASVFNTLGRIFWGSFADRTSYRTSMLLLTGFLTALYASLEVTVSGGRFMYAAWILLIYFTFAGTFAMLPPATSQTFGQSYAGPNYGLVYCNGIFAPVFQSLVLENLTGVIGHIGVLLITAGCAACSFLITLFYDKTPGPTKLRARLMRRR